MNKRFLRPILSSFIAVALTVGCGGSIHPDGTQPLKRQPAVSYDEPYDIIVLSDPPGAKIVVDAETLAVAAPVTVRHTRKRHFGIPDFVWIGALAIAPGQCRQFRAITYDRALPDSIVFHMTRCPKPDQDYSKVFRTEDQGEAEPVPEGEPPVRLRGPMPFYPENLQSAGRQGIVLMQVVIDTTGIPEPGSFRVVVASDSGFIQSARTALLGSVFKPGRVSGHKVRTQVTVPITYTTRSGPP